MQRSYKSPSSDPRDVQCIKKAYKIETSATDKKAYKLKPVQQKKSKPKKNTSSHRSTRECVGIMRCEDASYKFFPLRDTFPCPCRDQPGSLQKKNNPFSPTTVIHLYSCIFKRTIPNVSAFSPRLSQMENKAGCWSALRWRNSGRLSVSILTTQGLLRLQALPLHVDRHR